MNDTDTKITKGQSALLPAAFFGECPQCGERTLFRSWTGFADKCSNCGLDFSRYNVGDGPAAFLTLGIGALIVVLALIFEFSVNPPFWLHILIWPPFTAALVVISLRVAKGMLLILEHRRDAHEGATEDRDT